MCTHIGCLRLLEQQLQPRILDGFGLLGGVLAITGDSIVSGEAVWTFSYNNQSYTVMLEPSGGVSSTAPAPDTNGGGAAGAANTATSTTHWHNNPCVTSALKSGAVSVGVDALGFLPEAGGVARVVGHQAGYVGIVADNLGKNMLTAGTKTTGVLSSATGFSSSDWTTWVSAGITAADFVPVLSDFTTPVAMAWDAGVAAYKVYQCPK